MLCGAYDTVGSGLQEQVALKKEAPARVAQGPVH
jgi:microcompartment protein CcmK/EutM